MLFFFNDRSIIVNVYRYLNHICKATTYSTGLNTKQRGIFFVFRREKTDLVKTEEEMHPRVFLAQEVSYR